MSALPPSSVTPAGAPPSGGFGVPTAGQREEISHSPIGPRLPSSAFHFVMVVSTVLMAALFAFGGLCMYRKSRDARGAEAMVGIAQIADGLRTTYVETGALCPSARPIPADFEAVRGKTYRSGATEWEDDPGWSCVGFAMDRGQRYQYRLDTTGEFFTITAAGDFDGDDVRATYAIHGHVDRAHHRLELEPGIQTSNPGE